MSELCTKMGCNQRVRWPSLGNTSCEMCVSREMHCVMNFVFNLCIIMHCRTDDIQDNSTLRRGIPVAHSIYGVASTINAASYVLFIALERLLSLNHPDATTVYTEQLLELHQGQGIEIYWRENYICPSVEEYQEMVKRSKNRVRAMGRF